MCDDPQPTASAATSAPPAANDIKAPPPPPPQQQRRPSRVAVAAGRVARMRWVTVAGVVAVGLGGIMVADWAAESLVNTWQARKGGGGEDDF
jgi:pyruvate/2-oxoglutarate dehydrogenase complex dihydrolipoamide acyltransferase (E2) component